MKARSKRLLRGLVGIFAGVAAIAVCKSNIVMAAGTYSLVELNVGVAQYLDTMDRGVENSTTHVKEEEPEEEPESKKSNIAIANVQNSLNVREEASEESKKIGLLYADCGGTILEQNGDWTKIQSGNLVGWCRNDYLFLGEEAEKLAKEVGRTLATVNTDALRVRKEPDENSGIWGLVARGESIEAITDDKTDEWVAIDFEGEEGYISAEYVEIELFVDHGETFEEIKEREKREREEKAKLIRDLGPVAVGATDESLLASLVYWEAGNQSYEGKLAVAAVVMNRVRSGAYPNTVGGVIYASGQFTPALNGKVALTANGGVPQDCVVAAREAIAGKTNVGGATHFRRWTGQNGIVIGAHVFY